MIKVLITDDCHPILIEGLAAIGFSVDFIPYLSLDEIDDILPGYQGIIVNTRVKMDRQRISRAPNLQFIGRMGSGLDIIDLPYAAERGIKVVSSPEGNAPAVGEHSLAMLLSLLNKLPLGARQVRDFAWDREAARGRQLSGSTVGIIGYGYTGPAFARVLSGFEVTVKVFDKYKDVPAEQKCLASIVPATFEEVIGTCDIISFNLPLTDETAFLIDESLIRKMKTGVILINAARGRIADLSAIIQGLGSGQIGGCCLDVFPNEKTTTYTAEEAEQMRVLSMHPNVILTPHVAGWTYESRESIARILVAKIKENILSN